MTAADPIETAVRALVKALRDELVAKRDIKPANDRGEYLSTEEAAELARMSPHTIRKWVRTGRLPRHGTGARVLIRRSELERVLSGDVTPDRKRGRTPEERARQRFG